MRAPPSVSTPSVGGIQVFLHPPSPSRRPLLSFPGIPILNDTPATSAGKRLPRFTRAYRRVLTVGAQLLATVTGGHKRGVTRDYRRYRSLPAATTLQEDTAPEANAEIFSSYRGLRNALIAKYWPPPSRPPPLFLFVVRNGNVTSSSSHIHMLRNFCRLADIFSHFLFFF